MDASQASSIVDFWDFSRLLNITTDPLSLAPLPRWTRSLVVLTPRLVHSRFPRNSVDVTKGRLTKAKPRLPGYAHWLRLNAQLLLLPQALLWLAVQCYLPKGMDCLREKQFLLTDWIGWGGKGRGFELNASLLVASTLVWVKAYDEQCTIMII